MTAYRKRPVDVEAEQYQRGSYRDAQERGSIAEPWPGATNPFGAVCYTHHMGSGTGGHLHTANGPVWLDDGTWVVRDPGDGDTWPVAPDIFAKNYEQLT